MMLAKEGVRKMTELNDSLNDVLTEHEQAITAIEGFLATHAGRAAAAPDPLLVQAAINRVRDQTSRLAALIQKYPVVS